MPGVLVLHCLLQVAQTHVHWVDESESHSVVSDSLRPHGIVHGSLQARILEWVAIPSPGDLPDPGIEPRSPALQADSLPAEPPGKKYVGGGRSS